MRQKFHYSCCLSHKILSPSGEICIRVNIESEKNNNKNKTFYFNWKITALSNQHMHSWHVHVE